MTEILKVFSNYRISWLTHGFLISFFDSILYIFTLSVGKRPLLVIVRDIHELVFDSFLRIFLRLFLDRRFDFDLWGGNVFKFIILTFIVKVNKIFEALLILLILNNEVFVFKIFELRPTSSFLLLFFELQLFIVSFLLIVNVLNSKTYEIIIFCIIPIFSLCISWLNFFITLIINWAHVSEFW